MITAQKAAISRIAAIRGAINRPVPAAPGIEIGVEPLRRETELIRRCIEQIHRKLLRSEVRLSAPGKIVRVLHHRGEFVQIGVPVLIVARPSTLHVVAYFDQRDTSEIQLHKEVRIVSSYAPEVTGWVVRSGPSLRIVPEPIARFYPRGKPLFPVEIELDPVGMKYLISGSVVRVFPSRVFATVRGISAQRRW